MVVVHRHTVFLSLVNELGFLFTTTIITLVGIISSNINIVSFCSSTFTTVKCKELQLLENLAITRQKKENEAIDPFWDSTSSSIHFSSFL